VRYALVASLGLIAAACAGPASSGTLSVGPGQAYEALSKAVAAARDGDTIKIMPGTYYDCAVVGQDNLTIEGTGPNVVLTDTTCQGKALLVVAGNNVTIRNLTLQRARVPDGNGAGIRAEGGNLTVENCRFLNNENGILAADNPEATILVSKSAFIGNGKCENSCAHGIYVNHVRLLRVEDSVFKETRQGHHIKSRAARTEIVGNDIQDGPDGTSSYLIDIPNGGSLVVERNRMQKGPNSENGATAIMIGAEGVTQPTDELIFRDNRFTNDQSRPTTFVNNVTATPAILSGGDFQGQVRPLAGDGSVRP
jgi:nitrous oxidase accessory protein NosD